jgi:hypothetical protein
VAASSSSSSSAASVIGYPDSATTAWEAQRHVRGCWLACMAVLTSRQQQEIQESLGWPDDAFYGIGDGQLAEFSQLLKWPVEQIPLTAIERVYASLSVGDLAIIQVPGHVMVVFAAAADHSYLRIWDPTDASFGRLATATLKDKARSFFVHKRT